MINGVKVSELVDDIIEENNINTDNILGIGITMPGIFNSDNTMIISSPPLNTRDYKTDNITSRLKYDYTVQNDARASAFADYWYSIRMKMLIWTSPITTNSIL